MSNAMQQRTDSLPPLLADALALLLCAGCVAALITLAWLAT